MTTSEFTEIEYPALPPKVAKAISDVMSSVTTLGKGKKNEHGNFKFASIDDFLEAVRPLCAEHGLIIIQDELSFDIREGKNKDGKSSSWLVVSYGFTLAHSSGETWTHRPVRTIMVNAAMGSQAFGAAQSYALKQFERALFQIATGDMDADAIEAQDSKGPPLMTGRHSVSKLKALGRDMYADLAACEDEDQLHAFLNSEPFTDWAGQVQRDVPHWWHGRGDEVGFKDHIERQKQAIAERIPEDHSPPQSTVATEKPHEIGTKQRNGAIDWKEWSTWLSAALKNAKDGKTRAAWMEANEHLLGECGEQSPDVHGKIMETLDMLNNPPDAALREA